VKGAATLVVKGPTYFSAGDERSFFEWLDRIPCIERVRGEGDGLQVLLKPAPVSDASLRELIAVFHRYGLDKLPLKQFLSAENAGWFRNDPQAYWHADNIFGG
jgi:hypothetical protein